MISPETSGAIFTSTSGWILPVAVTSCVIVLRNAFSVVTGIGFSRFFDMPNATAAIAITRTMPTIQYSFFRDFFGLAIDVRGPAVMRRFTPDGRQVSPGGWE